MFSEGKNLKVLPLEWRMLIVSEKIETKIWGHIPQIQMLLPTKASKNQNKLFYKTLQLKFSKIILVWIRCACEIWYKCKCKSWNQKNQKNMTVVISSQEKIPVWSLNQVQYQAWSYSDNRSAIIP